MLAATYMVENIVKARVQNYHDIIVPERYFLGKDFAEIVVFSLKLQTHFLINYY